MELQGRVQNGVVVLAADHPALPEGAAVTVTYPSRSDPLAGTSKMRVQLPLVRSGRPGSVHLTGERIAVILDDEDAAPRR